ncbi:MAG: glycosyltransferase family 39 protein [Patescibacteria group bacterium]
MQIRFSTVALILVICIALFFSLYKLTESPSVWYDEGWYTQAAMNLAETGVDGLQLAPDNIYHASLLTTVGYPLIYPLGLWMKIFGSSVLAARSFMLLCILGFLFVAFLLIRRLSGKTIALGALALLATLPTLYGNGKSVLGEVPGLLYLVFSLLCISFVRSDGNRKYSWIILGGVSAGLCIVTKPLFLVFIPALAVGTFLEWKRGSLNLKEVIGGIVCALLPVLVWVMVQFRGDTSMLSVIKYYANPYQITDLFSVILSNVGHLFTSIGNIYLVGTILIWCVALALRMRSKNKIPAEEIIAFIFTLLVIAAFLRTAGWYRYLFPAQVLSLLFFPGAFSVLGEYFGRYVSVIRHHWQKAVVVIIVFLSVYGTYQLAFDSWVAEAYSSHKTAFWQEYLGHLPPTRSVFFYNTPEVVIFMPHRNYRQYIVPAGGVVGQDQLLFLELGIPDVAIVESDSYTEGKSPFENYTLDKTAYKYSILKKK